MTDKDIVILKYTGYSNDELKTVIYEKETKLLRLEEQIEELKAHCKAVDEVNNKMKNCQNCKYSFSAGVGCMQRARRKSCNNYELWELAECNV